MSAEDLRSKLEADVEAKYAERDRDESVNEGSEAFRSFPWARKLLSWGIEARGQNPHFLHK